MNQPASALTLRLRDPRTAPQAPAQVHWERAGGSIGRGAACDWVLEADGVSRLHASVRCLDGLFFIEDHSTNGVLHNGAALRAGVPIALKHGDWLKIDVFEIEVAIGAESSTAQMDSSLLHSNAFDDSALNGRIASEDAHAFMPDVAISVLPAPQAGYVDEHDIHALLAGPQAPVSIDPLALFDSVDNGGADEGRSQWSMGGWNHTPAASASYRSPPTLAAVPSPSVLPENWDLTRTQYAPEPEPPVRALAALPAHSHSAAAQDVATFNVPEPKTEPRPEPIARIEPASIPAPIAILGRDSAPPIAVANARPDPASASHITAKPLLPPETLPSPARIDRSEREHASAPLATALLATTMAGVMDLLRARAEFKNGLRLPSTLVQRRENNPLKFAPSVEEAIERLLGPGDGAYLSGEDAIEDAMRDIRHHQLALIAAMRIAMDNAFARFDPARFESEANAKSALGQWSGKAWRQYREYYRTLREDPDERYRRLFGDEFARAYEEQMSHLKSSDTSAYGSGRS